MNANEDVDLAPLIGDELRSRRVEAEVGLRQLAREVGVSASFLSQVEHGKSYPSVATLYAITSRLGISLDDLFRCAAPAVDDEYAPRAPSWEAPADGPVLHADKRLRLSLARGVIWERLTARDDELIDFVYCTYAVGAESAPEHEPITHEGREYGVVLSGTCAATVGERSYRLGPGDSLTFEACVPHRIWNVGDEPMTLVWVVVGRRQDRRFEIGDRSPRPGRVS